MAKRLLLISLLVASLSACKYSRYVPDGQYLLWENEIELQEGGKASSSAEGVIRQQPNDNLLLRGLRPGLALHSWGNGEEDNFWSRLGSEPVIYDRNAQSISQDKLRSFYFNRGYFQAQVSTEVERNEKRQRASVKYLVKLGPRYRIDTISYQIVEGLAGLDPNREKESKLKAGQFYDLDRLDQERNRLKNLYRNQGFYNFSQNYINYEADTNNSAGQHKVELKLIIKGVPRRQGDSIVYDPPKQYRIENIYIVPDYDFQFGTKASDTINHLNYKIAASDLEYEPRYLTDAVHFYQGSLYRQYLVDQTYQHYAGYNAFNVTEITFREDQEKEGILQAEIRLIPRNKRSWITELEVTNTTGNYGIRGSIGIVNRNLFKGGEALSFNVGTGLEYQPTVSSNENLSRTFEIGTELRIDFPRFLLPFNTEGLLPKRMLPRSSASLYANRITRIEFDRETFGGRLGYEWNESSKKSHKLNLLNISFSNLYSIDTNFINQLDPIQQFAFNSEFISSTTYKFTYSGQESVSQQFYNFFSSDLEIGGNLQSVLTYNGGVVNDASPSTLFGVPVYQFARMELDYRYYIHPSPEELYIFRFVGGYVLPYGLSQFSNDGKQVRFPPFSRFFFLGGTNDLRAWPAYRAGGGRDRVSSYDGNNRSSFALGTMKLLSNFEYRFPIYSSLKGALFLDAGNIWLTGGLEDARNNFKFNSILSDLYLGSGLGLRLDLDFFVIRLDTGVRLRDPGYQSTGEEWVIATQDILPNLTFNLALGYPF